MVRGDSSKPQARAEAKIDAAARHQAGRRPSGRHRIPLPFNPVDRARPGHHARGESRRGANTMPHGPKLGNRIRPEFWLRPLRGEIRRADRRVRRQRRRERLLRSLLAADEPIELDCPIFLHIDRTAGPERLIVILRYSVRGSWGGRHLEVRGAWFVGQPSPWPAPLMVAEFIPHDSRPLVGSLNHGQHDAINGKPEFPELPANRTYRRHGPNDANDPNVWSGRASQEVFAEMAVSGPASMYPAFDWSSLCSGPSWILARVRSH